MFKEAGFENLVVSITSFNFNKFFAASSCIPTPSFTSKAARAPPFCRTTASSSDTSSRACQPPLIFQTHSTNRQALVLRIIKDIALLCYGMIALRM
jgi:hypothetical protein